MRVALALSALLLAVALQAAAQDVPDKLLKGCADCHGMNGVAVKPDVPHLDTQKPVYLSDSLKAFVNGSRPTAVADHAKLNDEQIAALSAHYAGQPVARPKGEADAALFAAGETVYHNRCADCHFENGRAADKDAPLMAAQNLNYLLAQTLAFRKGTRKFPFMMDDAYRGLSESDLTAVVHFFHGQDPALPPETRKRRRRK